MKVVITSSYPLRDGNITSYYSFPVYSTHIEETLCRQLEFLKQYDKFSLEMKITEGSEKSS
jgi:hypothetical protein